MVYRRFGTVFARLLLAKQDEISRLEAKLHGMDRTDEHDGNTKYLMSWTKDKNRDSATIPKTWGNETRVQLMAKLEKLALEYGEHRRSLFDRAQN